MKIYYSLRLQAAGLLFYMMFIFSGNLVVGQTYHPDFQDGKVYLKFNDNLNLDIPVNADGSVNLDNAPFLDGLRQKYDITSLSRPFDLNNDPKILRTFMLEFSQFEKIEEIITDLQLNKDLEYVEKVSLSRLDFHPNDSLYVLSFGSANWNWHLDVINAEQAWDFTTGSPDINVAIVDGAVWIDHPDLTNKIVLSHDVTQAGNQNSNPPAGGDPAEWSHGTHCAGLAGAETNNDLGVASIGYNVSLIGVKATSNSSPNQITNGYGGIQWAANNGANVISCSWGNAFFSQTEQNLINTVWGMGINVIGSAGNDNVGTNHYPSAYNHVISVASTNEDDIKSDFSNYGSSIDVCAPGGYGTNGPTGLISTTWDYTSYGYYDIYFGTSMATPLTAGLCGLIYSVNPELTPDEVEQVLESTCVKIDTLPGNATWLGKLGAGRIDAYAAVTHTPFAPTANFMTPVTTIMPGTTIQFFDQSQGVPNEWSWEFEGGSPHLSTNQNPDVLYSTEGTYNVSLAVTNDFGLDVYTVNDYITVTSTPVPWVLFSSDDDYTCVEGSIVFTDESLYNPTGWTWEFQPSTVTFVDGTTQNSQNPHVKFNAPGYYTVTLTATNANGSNLKTIDNMVFAEGIELNFAEDFEAGSSTNFVLTKASRANISIDHRGATPESDYGLHFQGSGITGNWSGGPFNTTPDQAWNVNVNFHAQADNCYVDAIGVNGVQLNLDLRQTFSIGNKYSWFRVLVNGEQIADVYGETSFNPETNTDPFETKIFDLSAYGNTAFNLTLQSSCYLADKFYAEGDNVFADNIMLSNTTSLTENNTNAGALTYPNPVRDILNYSAHGLGSAFELKIINVQGEVVYSSYISDYRNGENAKVMLPNLMAGVYILQLSSDSGVVTKKILKQ